MLEKAALEPRTIVFSEIGGVQDREAGCRQFAPQGPPCGLLARHHPPSPLPHLSQLPGRGQPVLAQCVDTGLNLPAQTGNAHHEEFVEVVRRNRQETQPL